MTETTYPIPTRLNIAITVVVVSFLLLLLYTAAKVPLGWPLFGVSLAYGILMTTGYSIIHEAEHNLLHPAKRVNDLLGVMVAFFFPAPYHLLRQGHLGHHMRNRSDDEAFDFYFEGENKIWKFLQLYGTMVGTFWLVVFLSNFLCIIAPGIFQPKYGSFDRPTEAFLKAFNPAYLQIIRLEALGILLFHGLLIWGLQIPITNWFLTLFGFGFLWSAMQYVHHYGTERDVQKGAKNLRTWGLLDKMWLNHNWHLNHHLKPTVPWIYLPTLFESLSKREPLLPAYLSMWKGPRFTNISVKNRYDGKLIK